MADDTKQNDQANQLIFEVSPEMLEGAYVNLAVITHNFSEFILDFGQVVPNSNKVRVKSRVVLNPGNAKRLMNALAENIKKFEAQFGPIRDVNNVDRPGFPPMSFTMPSGEA